MSPKFLIAFLVVAACAAVVMGNIPKRPIKCGKNEIATRCNAGCEATCKNQLLKNIACTKSCKAGCICKKGLVRNNKGLCIRPCDCKK